MDVNAETARKLREMGAAELLAALSAQDDVSANLKLTTFANASRRMR